MPDYADETTTELERKAHALLWIAAIETVTYSVLFYFWLVQPNVAGKAITGSVHGMVWLTFCAMVIMITPEMRWSWTYAVVVIVLGPIGGVMVWERIRRDGVPEDRRPRRRQRSATSDHGTCRGISPNRSYRL